MEGGVAAVSRAAFSALEVALATKKEVSLCDGTTVVLSAYVPMTTSIVPSRV